MDEEGNIAAAGTSIRINASTIVEDYDFGVIGTLSNGTLSIEIPLPETSRKNLTIFTHVSSRQPSGC